MGPSMEVPMLSKCANPACSRSLVYLREGKIFRMEHVRRGQSSAQDGTQSGNSRQIEHFWLCGACSAHMTLVYDKENGVQVLPKQHTLAKAAS